LPLAVAGEVADTEIVTSSPTPEAPGPAAYDFDDTIVRPTEMIRIQAQLEALAEELRSLGTLPDEDSRLRLSRAERDLRDELAGALAPQMGADLTSDELRLGLREMLGWVEGLLASLQFGIMRARAAAEPQA
jgi:hypothetical protein